MTLKIIGSGFGRTGTRSLKEALEILGYAPCHHMEEVFANPPQVAYWQAVAARQPVDWEEVFAGYVAQIDWPGAHVWRETAAAFPEAKVIHSVRPPDVWWRSFSKTIGKLMTLQSTLPLPPHLAAMTGAMDVVLGDWTFAGKWADRDAAVAAFQRREAEVRAAIPAERLLVFDVAQGWEPLCRFLGVAVPDTPFPNRNQLDQFWSNVGGEPPDPPPAS
jgi:hypothetical protein